MGICALFYIYIDLPSLVSWYSRHLFSIHWGGPLAKVGSSAKFGVVVFKASILNSLVVGVRWGPSAKVCLSAKFCALVFKASMLYQLEGPLAKESSSDKY